MCKRMLMTLIFTLLFGVFSRVSAQTIDDICTANENIASLTADFTQTVTNAARKTTITSTGKIYVGKGRLLAMHYNEPSEEIFIINNDALYMSRGGRTGLYDTTKNKPMNELASTILGCVQGKCSEVAKATSSELSYKKVKNGVEVVIKSTIKRAKGYSEIKLVFDSKSCLLRSMLMREHNGNTTLYEISNHNTATSVKPSVFDISQYKK